VIYCDFMNEAQSHICLCNLVFILIINKETTEIAEERELFISCLYTYVYIKCTVTRIRDMVHLIQFVGYITKRPIRI